MRTFRTFAWLTLLATASIAAVTVATTARADKMATGDPAATFDITNYVTGLGDTTDFRFLPDGRMIITEKGGAAKVRTAAGTVVAAGTFQVSTTSEQGLLGVEVHPDFATNKTLFFYYSQQTGTGTPVGSSTDRHRIVSVVLKDDNTLDMSTMKVLASGLLGPANHDGGSLGIGPDKKLYFGVGDTGCNSGVEPGGTITNYFATCLTNGNGKIHRINLDGTIPDDNPLKGLAAVTKCGDGLSCGTPISSATGAPRDSIWAWGFRNPWRFWFDPVTGKLWVGDVGEVTYEEITIVQKGRHHGWPFREGAHGYPITKCNDVTPGGDCVDPLYDCSHSGTTATEDGDCKSISGGQILDACQIPATYRGKYIFGDNANGTIWTVDVNATRDGIIPKSRKEFAFITTGSPVSLRVGPDGAIYAAIYTSRIARIAPKTPEVCDPDAGPGDAGVDAKPPADTGGDSAPGTDTGTPGGDSSTGGDGSTGNDAGPGDGASESSSGCGCRVASEQTTSTFVGLSAGAGLMLLALRRRRRPRD
jgi:MYXO-CTERM domain-containing protein